MANLLGQNIGTNYKGILNLNTLNGNLSGTLQAVTDGSGNASPLQLSTTQAAFAGFSGAPDANIVWRANGTLTDYTGWHQSDGNFRIVAKNVGALWLNINDGINFSAGFSSANRSNINLNGNWNIGGAFTNAARVHVRGDGTNAISRFESNAGVRGFIFTSIGDLLPIDVGQQNGAITAGFSDGFALGGGIGGWRKDIGANHLFYSQYQNGFRYTTATNTATSGTSFIAEFNQTFAAAAGSANFRPLNFAYTINNSGAQTGTATGIFLNATETALNGMGHNLIDLQRSGNTVFRVSRTGETRQAGYAFYSQRFGFINSIDASPVSFLNSTTSGIILLTNQNENDFNRLQFGGTTNAFPALKRNGAALEVVLANDTGFAAISASRLVVPEGGTVGVANGSRAITFDSTGATNLHTAFGGHRFSVFSSSAYVDFVTITGSTATPSVLVNTTSNVVSSLFTIESTTRGFLPPRMTETQRNAIATPAAGLIVYNTTTNLMNFYNGTIWMAF